MPHHILALDQGTTSSRAIIFDDKARIVGSAQREHEQIFPRAGWVEHDPEEIWANTSWAITQALSQSGVAAADLAGIGITNQRETVFVWDRRTGKPVYNAIVWQDTRTQELIDRLSADGGTNRFAEATGLPLATYFSASKIAWILQNVDGARADAEAGHLAFGTSDSWIIWNLTGGASGGQHVTDITNASRSMLMDLAAVAWSDEMLAAFDIPRAMLPEIRSSSADFGHATGPLTGIPIAGVLGDQQAATFGQAAFEAGQSKNTYGTGCFLLISTGTEIVRSDNGLITTLGYRVGEHAPHYAIEGSIAVAGSLVQWLRDNLGIISEASDIEKLAASVDDNGGAALVPAFSGLFAPHWRPDARGVLVGLTGFVERGHIARAALESTAFQTKDVLDAAVADLGASPAELRVDGGMTRNSLLMQFQADILGIPVVRPEVIETTALGAAYAAGLAVGVWASTEELGSLWREGARWEPQMSADERESRYRVWQKAVARSLDWVDEDVSTLGGVIKGT